MRGKHFLIIDNCGVEFDYIHYTIRHWGEGILDCLDKIQQNEEYQFLYKLFINKYSYERQLYDADEKLYLKLQSEYFDKYN